MKLFNTKAVADLEEKLDQSKAEVSSLSEANTKHEETISKLKKENADLTAKLDNSEPNNEEIATLKSSIKNLTEENSKLKADIETEKKNVKKAEESASKKAIEIAANAGHAAPKTEGKKEDEKPQNLSSHEKMSRAFKIK